MLIFHNLARENREEELSQFIEFIEPYITCNHKNSEQQVQILNDRIICKNVAV